MTLQLVFIHQVLDSMVHVVWWRLQDVWQQVMVQHMRRHAERLANMFVVNATTPAQMFHALRRQLNRPFQKPLVLLTPKYLLHHRPATSALQDFTTGTFFNRVIDDGKVQFPPRACC